jgi:hypothetical protein
MAHLNSEEFRQWLIAVDDDETEIEDLYKEFLVEKLNNQKSSKLNLNLKIKNVDLLLTSGTDLINITLDEPTSFPIMGYETIMKIECQKGYGEEYCLNVLGVEPTIKDVR